MALLVAVAEVVHGGGTALVGGLLEPRHRTGPVLLHSPAPRVRDANAEHGVGIPELGCGGVPHGRVDPALFFHILPAPAVEGDLGHRVRHSVVGLLGHVPQGRQRIQRLLVEQLCRCGRLRHAAGRPNVERDPNSNVGVA